MLCGVQDPNGQDRAALARVLVKVSSRASRASISSTSGRPRPPNSNSGVEANQRSTFSDLGSPPVAEPSPREEDEEGVDTLIAAMSEVCFWGRARPKHTRSRLIAGVPAVDPQQPESVSCKT